MLDFEYAKALAEVVLDTTCSKKEREKWKVCHWYRQSRICRIY